MLSSLSATDIIIYGFMFISLYFQVFLVITFLNRRKALHAEHAVISAHLITPFNAATTPSVAIFVPCFNEEKTLSGTIDSLLALDYPKDKLSITIVDDGSSDNTWSIAQSFATHPQINAFTKENGGKHTALNFALAHTTAEIVGCLDADSYVGKDTLRKLIRYFDDSETMAVTPALKIHNPSSMMQRIQSIEYKIGVFLKKLYEQLDAIHVTPGPFSLFRRRVFDELGVYRKAHNTEDMEMAMRMQSHNYKIRNCATAWVYTCGPKTLKKLYVQRVRWTYGFIKNTIDYRHLVLNPKYGNIGMITIPTACAGLLGIMALLAIGFTNWIRLGFEKYELWSTVGINPEWPRLFHNLFYVRTSILTFVSIILLALTVTLILTAKKYVEGSAKPDIEFFLYIIVYPIIAPLWLMKSVYNAALSKKTSWR